MLLNVTQLRKPLDFFIALETNREARPKVRQWNDDNPEN